MNTVIIDGLSFALPLFIDVYKRQPLYWLRRPPGS